MDDKKASNGSEAARQPDKSPAIITTADAAENTSSTSRTDRESFGPPRARDWEEYDYWDDYAVFPTPILPPQYPRPNKDIATLEMTDSDRLDNGARTKSECTDPETTPISNPDRQIEIAMDDNRAIDALGQERQSDKPTDSITIAEATENAAAQDEDMLSLEDWKKMCTKFMKDMVTTQKDRDVRDSARNEQIAKLEVCIDELIRIAEDVVPDVEQLQREMKKTQQSLVNTQRTLDPSVPRLEYTLEERLERLKRLAHKAKLAEILNIIVPQLVRTAEDPRPIVVMMCGIAGSGKSSLAHAITDRRPHFTRISIDGTLYATHGRYKVDYDPSLYSTYQDEAEALCNAQLTDLLNKNRDVVLDRSFYAKSDRDAFKQIIENAGGRWLLVYHRRKDFEQLWLRIEDRKARRGSLEARRRAMLRMM
ncbi:uncharacterized protein AB675_11706 [Cyphellophora attinorum]|uniref:Zeta toxin domain-containing protein n=1 Tax=Cyphellophora attinorum TaxID=1664694 RepID=A0A0N1HLK7_9EURO|nr:uncharacterized protein AB675_11706 [Phialophora attinorum]KPI35432.1 hypothetical protein AB675_11706 [Phialophora attinorum]